jgi:hypothetical protein
MSNEKHDANNNQQLLAESLGVTTYFRLSFNSGKPRRSSLLLPLSKRFVLVICIENVAEVRMFGDGLT